MSRYIDADRLVAWCMKTYQVQSTMAGKQAVNAFLTAADSCPTADVVEVRHGEWIDKPTGAYCRMQSWCSACGKHSGIGGIESNRHKPYCPNCGAKMDGERKEANEG